MHNNTYKTVNNAQGGENRDEMEKVNSTRSIEENRVRMKGHMRIQSCAY